MIKLRRNDISVLHRNRAYRVSLGSAGYTLLEMMLVVTLISIMLGLSVLFYQTSQVRADVNSQVSVFVSNLRLAQSKAQSGNDNTSHGIHLESGSYTIFEGDVYSSSEVTNYVISLPPSMAIQNISLNGGGSDIIFDPPYGETDEYGSLNFYASQITKTETVTISALGVIEN